MSKTVSFTQKSIQIQKTPSASPFDDEYVERDRLEQKNKQIASLQQLVADLRRKYGEQNNFLVQKNVRLQQQYSLVASEKETMQMDLEDLKLENAKMKGRNEELEKLVQQLLTSRVDVLSRVVTRENVERSPKRPSFNRKSSARISFGGGDIVVPLESQENEVLTELKNGETVTEVITQIESISESPVNSNGEPNTNRTENVITVERVEKKTNRKQNSEKVRLAPDKKKKEKQIANPKIKKTRKMKSKIVTTVTATVCSPKKRRTAVSVESFVEPSLKAKLRRGDHHTFGIDCSNLKQVYKHYDS